MVGLDVAAGASPIGAGGASIGGLVRGTVRDDFEGQKAVVESRVTLQGSHVNGKFDFLPPPEHL